MDQTYYQKPIIKRKLTNTSNDEITDTKGQMAHPLHRILAIKPMIKRGSRKADRVGINP